MLNRIYILILLSFSFLLSKEPMPDKMAHIKGGTFRMGDTVKMRDTTIAPFLMDKYEVTNAEYRKCVEARVCTPPHYADSLGHRYDGKDWPQDIVPGVFRASEVAVTCVDWFEAKKYCEWQGKRLPTEAEWEFAARAGTRTNYYWGNEINPEYSWYKDNAGDTVHQPGLKKPNAFGLYDMSGNVWEWCEDWFDAERTKKIFKGGSWMSKRDAVFSFSSKGAAPESKYCNNGFRCVK